MSRPVEIIEGAVEDLNDKGLKLKGQWYNVSQFRPVQLPAKAGAWVRIGIDPKNWIQELSVLEHPAAAPANSSNAELRLGVLTVAAEFVGRMSQTRSDVRSDHVLPLAEKWLEWVNA
jgi:hypothetical protein